MIDYAATFSNFSGSFPNIEAINVSAPGAGDGTEFVAALVNDIWGRAQALMDYAGLTPDGVQEAPGTAQIMEAISKGFGVGPGMGVIWWPTDDPATLGYRVLLLQGQVIDISGDYAPLALLVYCGDGDNATAASFYKTSDAGGTIRSTAGTYMVLPDARAVGLVGTSTQTINTRVKTGPERGQVLEDQGQGHHHSFTYSGQTIAAPGSSAIGFASGTTGLGQVLTPISDGVNGTPRTGATFEINRLGTRFGITY